MNYIKMFPKRKSCIRCNKELTNEEWWMCKDCIKEIKKVDKQEQKFYKLLDEERNKIINMTADEFLKYCEVDEFLLTDEEDKVFSAKRYNEEAEELREDYNCKICNNKGFINNLEWKDEEFVITRKQCSCWKIRESIELLKKSGLETLIKDCTFKKFNTDNKWQQEVKNNALYYLDYGKNKWFAFTGASGIGKTHLCTAIIRGLLYKCIQCKYMVWDSEVIELNAIVNEPIFATRMDELKEAECLYIDDFFKPLKDKQGIVQPPTQGELKRAKDIIDYRYRNKLQTIISSERSVNEIMVLDEAIGGRIFQMVKGYNNHEKGSDKNYRLK